MRTSILVSPSTANRVEPQEGQKWRLSLPADQCRVSPVTVAWLRSQTAKAINADPVSRRQVWQWQTPARDDWAAADRALSRSSTGLTLEDWTWFGAADKTTEIPWTSHSEPRLIPAENQGEEGKIILLPRAGGNLGPEDWMAYVCLQEDDMVLVLDQMEMEGRWRRGN